MNGIIKAIKKPVKNIAKQVVDANKVNKASNANKSYLQAIGAISKKANEGHMNIEKIAEKYISPELSDVINEIGYHKVATKLMKQEGTDYGNPEKLNIVKVATILGTKLAMINREQGSILKGLMNLKDLEG